MSAIINENTQYVDTAGNPLVDGKIYIGISDSDPVLNPTPIFSDRELSLPLANPQPIDADGRAANKMWISGRYSLQVDDVNAVLQYQELDNGTGSGNAAGDVIPAVDVVIDLEAVETSGFLDGKEYRTRGKNFVGDHGEGTFIWDGSSVEVADGGIVVQPDGVIGGAPGRWIRQYDGGIHSEWYGAHTDNSATVNTDAFNLALNYIRFRIEAGNPNEDSRSITTGPGVYEVTTINATGIRSNGWSWHSEGVTFKAVGAGKAVIDLLNSRHYTLYNLTIRGDETNMPRVGFQTGYVSDGVSSGVYNMIGCFTRGFFSLAGYLNGGGEEVTHIGCQFRNINTTTGSYTIIQDGWNFWGKRSDYFERSATLNHIAIPITNITQANPAVLTTDGEPNFNNGDRVIIHNVVGMTEVNENYYTVANKTDNTIELSGLNSTGFGAYVSGGFVNELQVQSFVQTIFDNCSGFKNEGGPSIWMSANVSKHTWRSCYAFSDADQAVTIKIDPVIQSVFPHFLTLDIGVEGGALHSVFFDRTGTTNLDFNMEEFKLIDQNPQVITSIIGTNDVSASSVYNFIGGSISIADFPNTTNITDTPAKFSSSGNFVSRASVNITQLPSLSGALIIPDANVTDLPIGGYPIRAPKIDGVVNTRGIHKGPLRFYGTEAALPSGDIATEPFVEVSGDHITLPELSANPVLVNGVIYYRGGTVRLFNGVNNEIFATGPSLGQLSDDTAVAVPIPGVGSAVAVVNTNGGSSAHTMLFVRSPSSNSFLMSNTIAAVTVTTGNFFGTDGVDGQFTISAGNDGNMYIENRSGGTLAVSVTWLAVN